MKKLEVKERIEKLKKEIAYHRYLYHVLDKVEISDAALDSLKNELFKLEMDNPEFITGDSPTQRIGGKALDKFQKVTHSSRMLSLFDAFSGQDMIDWEVRMKRFLSGKAKGGSFEKSGYFVELKLDGLASVLKYEGGKFVLGATRGDGRVGENVTVNLRTIEGIPLSLRVPERNELRELGFSEERIDDVLRVINKEEIEVRGETVMSLEVFEKLNKEYEKKGKAKLANPRNGAAGSIRQLNPRLAAERELDFCAYDLVTDFGFETHQQKYNFLRLLGFRTLKENCYCKDLKAVEMFHSKWEKNRGKLAFEVDGIVVKVNSLDLQKKLGVVGKAPRYMMAYKFAAEQVTTKVKEVVWQIGRTGVLTPIAVLEPVQVAGVVVGHATLHNMDEIERLGLRIGDTIILERAGDVIPKVVQVLEKLRNGEEKEVRTPERCPICDAVVEKIKGEVAFRCMNKQCYAVLLRKLMHWVSKGALDIEGLGPKIVEQLVQKGLVGDLADFYSLELGDLEVLDRFAEKSAKNLLKSIEKKRSVELNRFIYGLGIRHVGEETALLLVKKVVEMRKEKDFKMSVFEFVQIMQSLKLSDLENLSDVGPVVAKSIYDWFRDEGNMGVLKKLEDNGFSVEIKGKKQGGDLIGKVFVLTGGMESLTRSDAKDKIREKGANVSSSVSKKTDFVVAGVSPGSKYEKAKELGLKILSEGDFVEMMK